MNTSYKKTEISEGQIGPMDTRLTSFHSKGARPYDRTYFVHDCAHMHENVLQRLQEMSAGLL